MNSGKQENMALTMISARIKGEFYHVHKYSCDKEMWHRNEVINTKTLPKRIIKPRENPLKHFAEYDYECIRKQAYSDYPSRLTCAFFFMDRNNAAAFKDEVGENAQIVKVGLLQGKYVKCDQNIFNKCLSGTQRKGIDEYDYWNGGASTDPLWEILFEGCFVVDEVI